MSVMGRYTTVQTDGVVTHVLVPIAEFQRLVGNRTGEVVTGGEAEPPRGDQIDEAIAILNDKGTKWEDAESVFRQIVRDGVEHARKSRGLSQTQLGKRVGLSQTQVSRMESNPDNAAVGVLRRIAAALAIEEASARGASGDGGRGKRRRAV